MAQISRGALAANIAAASSGRIDDAVLVGDARADGWGHGARAVAVALRAAGVDLVRVDHDALRSLAESVTGLTTTAEPNLDPLSVFGLPGGDPSTRPVLRLSGEVLGTKRLLRGEGVSYGYLHRAAADTRVALVTGGYAQGIVRGLGDHASVTIDGVLHPIVGRVAMDVCVVDIRDADIPRGSEAVFFGDPARSEPDLAEWVAATGLDAAELVTLVGQRSFRELVA